MPVIKEKKDQQDTINYFHEFHFKYGDHEIVNLQGMYDRIAHPIARNINELLEATFRFHCETAMDQFIEIRKKLLHDPTPIIKNLNTLAAAIRKAEAKCKMIQDKEAHRAYADAIAYCKKSIKVRLNRLRTVNDKIYIFYKLEDNDLKKLLKPAPKKA